MKTARFWVYHNGWVKLSLKDGDLLEHYSRESNEEGYSARYKCWHREGDTIVYETHTDSRDCDGRFSSSEELGCDIGQLNSIPARIERRWDRESHNFEWILGENPSLPQWEELKYMQRDYVAESMGY